MAGESALYKKFRAEQDAADAAYKSWEKDQWEKNGAEWTKQGYTRTEDPSNTWGSKWNYKKPTEQNHTPIKKGDNENPINKVPEVPEVPEEVVKPIPETIARPLDEASTNPYVSPWALYAKPSTTPTKPKKTQSEQGLWERAFRGLGLYSDPAVATASGWRHDQFGDVVQDLQNDELVTKLRNNLATIAGTALGVTNVAAKVANWGTSLPLLISNVTTNQAALPGPMNILRDQFGNIISSWKQGGTMNKVKYFSQGGAPTQTTQNLMSPEQELKAAVKFLQDVQAGNERAITSLLQILAAAKKGVPEAQRMMELLAQASKMMKSAKWGSKLEYIRSLKFAKGGKSCPVCEQQKVEMKKCGGKKAKKRYFGGYL